MVGSDDSFQNGPFFFGDTSHRLHVWSTYLWLKSMVSMLWVCFHVMGCFNLSRLQTTRAAGDAWTAPLGGELEPLSVAPPPRRKPWKRRERHSRQAQGKVQAKGRCCFFRGFLLNGKNLFLNFCWQFFWSLWLEVQFFADCWDEGSIEKYGIWSWFWNGLDFGEGWWRIRDSASFPSIASSKEIFSWYTSLRIETCWLQYKWLWAWSI